MSLLALDIGGTKTAVLLGTDGAQVLARREFATQPNRPFEDFLADLRREAAALPADSFKPTAISVAVGGPLDSVRGELINPPHFPQWHGIKLRDRIENAFSLPGYLMHDARAGAYAEWRFGAGREPNVRRLAFLTFATGFGCGIVLDGQVLAIPGEVGHWRVAEDGPELFGKAGSLEGLASGTGLAMQAAAAGKFPPGTTMADLAAAAREGNADARALLDGAAEQVGRQCARLIDLFGLDVVALGTIGVRAGDLLLEPIRAAARREALPHLAKRCRILPAALGERLGDVAAMAGALQAGWRENGRLGPTAESQTWALARLADQIGADGEFLARLDETALLVVDTLKAGGKILTCGNGGSTTDAAHLAEELVGRFRGDRPSLAAISLASDAAALTCIANDYGFEEVFARQIAGLGRAGDLLVGFTTSGNSENINRAFERARAGGLRTVAIAGKTGGRAKGLADVALVVPDNRTERIQEIHTLILHVICEACERAFS